ncbi:MAG: hypothetical protein K2X74_20000, partial [Acetobacteraceae bacterium]|nr:hypothetical protein [Acetobacteraceae bacterium]
PPRRHPTQQHHHGMDIAQRCVNREGPDPAEAFAPIRRHSAVRGAIARGAVVVEMPRLDPPELALEVERKRLGFGAARDGEGGLGPLNRAGIRAWMERMERAFAPVEPWLP